MSKTLKNMDQSLLGDTRGEAGVLHELRPRAGRGVGGARLNIAKRLANNRFRAKIIDPQPTWKTRPPPRNSFKKK